MEKIQLSDHFGYSRLLRFTLPSIIMMIFTSIYGVVDGFFVSNFAGKTPFTAINLIMPFLMILGTVGFMFGTGGSALVSAKLGEGKSKEAKEIFSMLIYISLGLGVVIALIGMAVLRPVAILLGAEKGAMLNDCVLYGRIVLAALPALLLQFEFHSFCVTAEKPKLGLTVTVASGVTNMVLDLLLVGVLKLGLTGAALATAISQLIGGFVPLIYFARKNTSLLKLGRTHFMGRALFKTCMNGVSELMSNISMSIVSMLYNKQLIKYAGENGVAAYGVLMYVNFIFASAFIGYTVGSAPIVGYNYGAGNHSELKNMLKKSSVMIGISALFMLTAAELLAYPLSHVFVGYDEELTRLTIRGFRIMSFSYLFQGFAIYGSSFFTALNDGVTSAIMSFLRTVIFQVAAVLLLPMVFGIDGIWYSIVVAEFVAMAVSVIFLIRKKDVYHYM
ncbi:MAG: MATE family efflux transporter [Ruminococcus sp.]|nr:MATE family efflux transporter [Ruminococcus sp.]